jgi:serine protease Do
MFASVARRAGAALGVALLGVGLAARAQAPAPPEPERPKAPAAPPSPAVPSTKPAAPGDQSESADPKVVVERARRGVVVIERGKRPIALGTVLHRDGRILTALSPLTHGNDIKARFADGTALDVRVGHSDRGADLALLVPERLHLAEAGLKASRGEAKAGAALQSFASTWNGPAQPGRVVVKSVRTVLGGDRQRLFGALEPAQPVRAVDYGAPLLDDAGDVVAVLVQACFGAEGAACQPGGFGVATATVKAFLRGTEPGARPPQPWVGVRVTRSRTGSGVRVRAIHPEGPAARAGIQAARSNDAGDVIVAVDGGPVATPRGFYAAVLRHSVGDKLVLLLLSKDGYREAVVNIGSAPPRRSHRLTRPMRKPAPPGAGAPARDSAAPK